MPIELCFMKIEGLKSRVCELESLLKRKCYAFQQEDVEAISEINERLDFLDKEIGQWIREEE